MTENEHGQGEHDGGEQSRGRGMSADRASEWEHPLATWRPAEPEQRDGRIARQQQPVSPGDRLSHLGHVERPEQVYAIMKPVPNSLPEPADTEQWSASFAAAARHVPLTIDFDPQPSINGWVTRGGTGKTSTAGTEGIAVEPTGPAADSSVDGAVKPGDRS
ncbi:hypothetical protein OHS33_38910 (plasmid) [Streptomyces sp. NBC_00536]|uniref:hypothetical protein n=1 Tax=Streptomyces sp. NBC_00536 TaxID=2975769 RepID=UPI002E801199|nr:hypothetical protein [Streptomyces sp. NBC_00536]WUC84329.1 hypothetical protein OHS33_38910 [Streptomyces sp. NBC_00536]